MSEWSFLLDAQHERDIKTFQDLQLEFRTREQMIATIREVYYRNVRSEQDLCESQRRELANKHAMLHEQQKLERDVFQKEAQKKFDAMHRTAIECEEETTAAVAKLRSTEIGNHAYYNMYCPQQHLCERGLQCVRWHTNAEKQIFKRKLDYERDIEFYAGHNVHETISSPSSVSSSSSLKNHNTRDLDITRGQSNFLHQFRDTIVTNCGFPNVLERLVQEYCFVIDDVIKHVNTQVPRYYGIVRRGRVQSKYKQKLWLIYSDGGKFLCSHCKRYTSIADNNAIVCYEAATSIGSGSGVNARGLVYHDSCGIDENHVRAVANAKSSISAYGKTNTAVDLGKFFLRLCDDEFFES